jgi:hypothetical protein
MLIVWKILFKRLLRHDKLSEGLGMMINEVKPQWKTVNDRGISNE